MTKRLLFPAGLAACVVALTIANTLVRAQAPTTNADRPTFDAASVKANTSAIPRVMLQFPGGRLNGVNITVQALLGLAYRVQPFQIVGAPDWIGSERYDVVATSAFTPTLDQRALMVQALLADRFRLTVHRETREVPIYALVLAKNDGMLGPRGSMGGNGQRTSWGVTMADV